MPVVIEELSAEVQPEPAQPEAVPGAGRPADGASAQAVLDLLDLARERQARLAVD